MKNHLASALRAAAFATTLFVLPAAFAQNADRAAQLLATNGTVRVESAGPYVAVGTYRIQVTTKLGRPSATLADGTMLYENYLADGSAATGTLVVQFAAGRVSSLSLAGPAVVAALRTPARKLGDKVLIAAWYQR
jgi:hypothetical protein